MFFNVVKNARTADEAWMYWYAILNGMNMKQQSRAGEVVGEIINAVTVIEDPTRGILLNKTRNMSIRYALGELLWYASANNKLAGIKQYTGVWDTLSDDGVVANSNYGYCIRHKYGFDQLAHVMDLLNDDSESRQAVIHIKEPSDKKSKDVNCTICLQFLVRCGKLYMTVYMRSNDIWLGFPYDVFNFTALQVYMAMVLNLQLGSYTHITGSLHLYKKDAGKEIE